MTPVSVSGLGDGVVAVSAGTHHGLALKADGSVWAWGFYTDGQLGTGTTHSAPTPVPVVGPGDNGVLDRVVAIAGGGYHSLALRSDGTVWAWGANANGQLGIGTTANSLVPVPVVGLGGTGVLTDVVAIAGGLYFSLALRSDGTVWTWGTTVTGGSLVPIQVVGAGGNGVLDGVVAIASSGYHSLALRSDGTVWAWGDNYYGQLGGSSADTCGTPPFAGPCGKTPMPASGLAGVTAIAANGYHSLALRSDGTLWAWGYNAYGQLGNGGFGDSTTPVAVSSLSNVTAISAGFVQSLAVTADGRVWAWGAITFHDYGDGSNIKRPTPVQVGDLTGGRAVTGGMEHGMAITAQ